MRAELIDTYVQNMLACMDAADGSGWPSSWDWSPFHRTDRLDLTLPPDQLNNFTQFAARR